MAFTVVFHYGGKFVKNLTLEYEGGKEASVADQDVDKWSYFEAVGMLKDLGFQCGSYRLWWKVKEDFCLDELFKRFMSDDDALKIAEYALKNKVDAHIYTEHFEEHSYPSDANEGTETVNEGAESEGEDSEESGDEIKGIHMDDSEEERTLAKDDGFPPEEEEIDT